MRSFSTGSRGAWREFNVPYITGGAGCCFEISLERTCTDWLVLIKTSMTARHLKSHSDRATWDRKPNTPGAHSASWPLGSRWLFLVVYLTPERKAIKVMCLIGLIWPCQAGFNKQCNRSIYLSFHSIYLSFHPSIHPSIHLSIYIYIYIWLNNAFVFQFYELADIFRQFIV